MSNLSFNYFLNTPTGIAPLMATKRGQFETFGYHHQIPLIPIIYPKISKPGMFGYSRPLSLKQLNTVEIANCPLEYRAQF